MAKGSQQHGADPAGDPAIDRRRLAILALFFHAGAFNFSSTNYQWLVVSGPKAQFKGAGEVNGQAGFGFLLTATDGQRAGGGGTDRFRIKIWSIATGQVVYDNVTGGSDDMDAAAPKQVSQGSITIHVK